MSGFRKFRARVDVPGEYIERGTSYPDWDNLADSWTTRPGYFQPGASEEDLARGDADRIAATFLLRDGRRIPEGSKLTVRGDQYRVIGRPEHWPSPTGALDHQRVRLEAWEVRSYGVSYGAGGAEAR